MRFFVIGSVLMALASPVEAQGESAPVAGLRIAAEVAGAVIGTALATAVSYPFGKAFQDDPEPSSCYLYSCDDAAGSDDDPYGLEINISPEFAGFTMHGLLAPPLIGGGVALAGHLFGRSGAYWGALAGAAIGMVGGMVLGIAAIDALSYNEGNLAFMLSVGILPVLGSLIGYEVTAMLRARRAERATTASPRWVPLAAVAPDGRGAILGARVTL